MYIKKYNFEPELKDSFIKMNKAWIERMFWIEEEDIRIFNMTDELVRNGAEIIFAMSDDNRPLSSAMLMPFPDGSIELAKFGIVDEALGKGVGQYLIKEILDYLKTKTKRVFIVSNTKCEAAIHIYKKFGFLEYEDEIMKKSFERCDILLEKYL